MTLFTIGWRTFIALLAPYFLALTTVDWLTDWRAPLVALGLGVLTAAMGALVAVLWAWRRGTAISALDKAIRAAIEKVAAGLGTVAFNSVADLMTFPNLMRLLIPSAIGAFVVTYLGYLGAVPAKPATDGIALPSQ